MSLKNSVLSVRVTLFQHLPIRKRRIVFLSHLGKTYGCNPRYLCEYLSVNYPGKFDLVWIYDRNQDKPILPAGVRAVPYFSHQSLRMINTAGFVVSNTRISDAFYFKKRTGQTYIQTWHSSLRLKCIEGDAGLGPEYEEFAQRDSAKTDVIFSGCTFSSDIFRKSFWYRGAIIESGTPRIDWLRNIDSQAKQQIFNKSGLSKENKYLLYAPTFRKGASMVPYLEDFNEICASLERRFGGQWRVLYRLHPNLKDHIGARVASNKVIDMTDYDDIQELLAISDLLLTDYSSSMFDAAMCGKLCMLYAQDLNEYIKSERALYFDIHKLPFPLATDEEGLIRNILSFDKAEYEQSVEQFLSKIGLKENGHACQEISKYILSRI